MAKKRTSRKVSIQNDLIVVKISSSLDSKTLLVLRYLFNSNVPANNKVEKAAKKEAAACLRRATGRSRSKK